MHGQWVRGGGGLEVVVSLGCLEGKGVGVFGRYGGVWRVGWGG